MKFQTAEAATEFLAAAVVFGGISAAGAFTARPGAGYLDHGDAVFVGQRFQPCFENATAGSRDDAVHPA